MQALQGFARKEMYGGSGDADVATDTVGEQTLRGYRHRKQVEPSDSEENKSCQIVPSCQKFIPAIKTGVT